MIITTHRCVRARVSLLLLLAALASAAEILQPLVAQPRQHIGALLAAIQRGQVDSLLHADPLWWQSPIGIGDETVEPMWHWRYALQRHLEQLEPALRTRAAALCQELASTQPQAIRHRFYPAPMAIDPLLAPAKRAFDQDRLRDFLHAVQALPGALHGAMQPQVEVAQRLLAEALPMDFRPGPMRRHPLPVAPASAHWQQQGSRLLALDGHGQTRWQRLFGVVDTMSFDAQLAVVAEATRWWLVNGEGRVWQLPRAAEEALLGVSGGRAWLQRGQELRGIGPAGSLHLRLLEPAVGPPLCWGEHSLWLTRQWLVHMTGDQLHSRWQHDLEDAGTWQWRWQGPQASVVSGTGSMLVDDVRACLVNQSELEQAVTLLRADRADEAWQLWRHMPPGPDRQTAWIELSRLAPSQPPSDPNALLRQGGERALQAMHQAWRARIWPDPDALADLAQRHPEVLLCRDAEPAWQPAQWQHVWTGRQLLQQLAQTPVPAVALRPARLPDGSWGHAWGERWLTLRATAAGTSIACSDAAGLLWRNRWSAPASLPSRSLRLRDDWLLVLEGMSRLHLLDPASGAHRSTFRLPAQFALPSQMRIRDERTLALLHPIGIDDHYALIQIQDDGRMQIRSGELRAPASDLYWQEGELVVRYPDGSLEQVR